MSTNEIREEIRYLSNLAAKVAGISQAIATMADVDIVPCKANRDDLRRLTEELNNKGIALYNRVIRGEI